MADEGRGGGGSSNDEDLSLPRATVQKLISEILPKDIVCAKETRDLISECGVEFIHLISAEANEICEKESKKTIAPEHVLSALRELGFEKYIEETEEVLKDHKQQVKEREKKGSKWEQTGLTEEELLEQQEQLFAAARARFEAAGGAAGPSGSS
ncbi:histone-fold-containing protein [Cantharellus anzutake]|uniref:histone-fold-containing protein n=1 Tax=Cantharellus anzutake TaxID=1750568 RepID=UPI0019067303|nr:histone-fold-containing protein [Cantharellus anzutake]KAF8332815.1 histone-fold-containing protein [Cantharellus anzutake]